MGPKKRPSHSKSKPPPTAKTTTAQGGASPSTANVLPQEHTEPQELSVIKSECSRTFSALRRGNFKKAQKHIKEACTCHENSPLLHHVQAIVHAKDASLITDHATKQKHLKNAVESAKKAVSLSPNSLDFTYFYANLLLERSNVSGNFEEVVKECERGLSIVNPIESDKESLLEVMQLKASNSEAIIPNILLQELESKLAIGESSEDPMLKIKKGVEERRMEIAVRVAAARLLQENSELIKSQEGNNKEIESNLPMNKLEKRKKDANLKKFWGSAGEFSQARSYWNSLSDEEKRGLLKPRSDDVWLYYYHEFEDDLAAKVFLGACDFFNGAKTWKYWECCICYNKFVESYLLIEHVRKEHASILLPHFNKVLPQEISSDWEEMILNCVWKPVDSVAAVKIIENEAISPSDQKWPLSDDSERVNILERIHGVFKLLLGQKYISMSNLKRLVEYAMDELETMVPASQLRVHGLYNTPLCFCFLGASQLKKVLELLREIYQACSADTWKGTSTDDELKVSQEYKLKETIVISDSTLCILDGDVDDVSAETFTEDDLVVDDDNLVYWLFVGDPIGEDLASWESLGDDKRSVGINIFQFLEKRLSLCESLCERKCEQMRQEEELLAIKSICVQELKKREESAEYIPQCFESLLRKRQDEYIQREDGSTADELYVISKVLEEALKANPEDLHQREDCIENSINRQLKKRSEEILKIDSRILSSYADMRQLEAKFAVVSFLDYRIIMLPLLKSFMKAQLDGLVHKDALEKSEAAREELLAELELDEEKNLGKGSDQMKRTEGKSKDKKKKKIYRYAKDSKASLVEQLQEGVEEQGQFPVTCDDDQVDEVEEEFRCILDFAEQERMLQEKLEYQRQIEEEAKQKQLAEENEEASDTTPEKEKETYASIVRKGLP